MSEWLEWLRQSDLYAGYAPGNVCFIFGTGPIAINPSPPNPGVSFLLTDTGDILTTDSGDPLLPA